MNKFLNLTALLALSATAFAQKDTIRVESVMAAGPYVQQNVITTTEKDGNDRPYNQEDMHWNLPMNMDAWKDSTSSNVQKLIANDSVGFVINEKGIYQLGFTVENNRYQKINFIVKSKSKNTLYVDGRQQGLGATLIAGRHDCVLKVNHNSENADTIEIKVVANVDTLWTSHFSGIKVNPEAKRPYTLNDHMTGERLAGASISANGRFVLESRGIRVFCSESALRMRWPKY